MEKILPTILIIIDVCASVHYLYQGNWRKAVYWICAAGLFYVVTW